jgi:hypothetical protein
MFVCACFMCEYMHITLNVRKFECYTKIKELIYSLRPLVSFQCSEHAEMKKRKPDDKTTLKTLHTNNSFIYFNLKCIFQTHISNHSTEQ